MATKAVKRKRPSQPRQRTDTAERATAAKRKQRKASTADRAAEPGKRSSYQRRYGMGLTKAAKKVKR